MIFGQKRCKGHCNSVRLHSGYRQYLITLLQIVLGFEIEKNEIFGEKLHSARADIYRSSQRVAMTRHSE